jgi:hypothetical protein
MSQWFHDFASVRWLSLVAIAVIALWAVAARYAGATFRERTEGARSEPDEEPAPCCRGASESSRAARAVGPPNFCSYWRGRRRRATGARTSGARRPRCPPADASRDPRRRPARR